MEVSCDGRHQQVEYDDICVSKHLDPDNKIHLSAFDLGGFKNLETLVLLNLTGCMSWAQAGIANTMVLSPGLRKLMLEVTTLEYDAEGGPYPSDSVCNDEKHDPQDSEIHADFWRNICVFYAAGANGHKLKIESLDLGYGLNADGPYHDDDDKPESNYMTKALNMATIKKIRFGSVDISKSTPWSLLDTATSLEDITIGSLFDYEEYLPYTACSLTGFLALQSRSKTIEKLYY